MRHAKRSPANVIGLLNKKLELAEINRARESSLLGLCLLGNILDGEALLADNSSHILSRHDNAKVLLDCAWSTKFS